MDITKENIEKYLLDKRGCLSRPKKTQYKEFVAQIAELGLHEDINTAIYLLYHGIECRKCKTCGKKLAISGFLMGWREKEEWCSKKCRDADPEYKARWRVQIDAIDKKAVREKIKKTNIERFGVDNYFKTDEWKTRIREFWEDEEYRNAVTSKAKVTMAERYEEGHYLKTERAKENTRARWKREGEKERYKETYHQTCMEKYGVDSFPASEKYKEWMEENKEEWKQAVQNGVIEKYGTHPMKLPEFRQRMSESSSVWLKKREQTCMEKYGVIHYSNPEKSIQTCLERYGSPYYFQSEEFKKWLSGNDGLITTPEYAIHELISELGLVAQAHNRTVLPSGKEIDIWVEEKRVGFEVNGVYWHSSWDRESDREAKKRHLEKSNWAKEAGIRLVHFTDIEIETKWPVVSSMIKSILGKTDRRIYARKCEVKAIDYQTGHNFLNETHIQGGAPCAIWIGLYHEDELVSVMGFNKARFDKAYQWELVRFASALNTTVVGGFSKCLKCFRGLNSGSVVSYADYSRSNGDVYRNNGFVEKGLSHPSYRWEKNHKLYNRHSFMHRNLAKMLGEESYNPEETEAENCWRNGYRRLWDCGQIKFVLE